MKMKVFLLGFALFNSISYARTQKDSLLECAEGSYRCADNSKCVLGEDLCNYKKDCNDLSDEDFVICQTIQGKRSSCSQGQIYSPQRACQSISNICNKNSGYYAQEFPTLCDYIKDGLKPFEEVVILREEITTILQKESSLNDLFDKLATSFNVSNWVTNNSHCPPLYVNIGVKCVAFFTLAQVSWAEARQFCESISGTLGIFNSLTDYQDIQKYLKEKDMTSNFWIGGFAENNPRNNNTWTWLNNKKIEMGAPYWTVYKTPACTKRKNSNVCYEYSIMPQGLGEGCLAMDYPYYYYFSNALCYEKRSPLCVHY